MSDQPASWVAKLGAGVVLALIVVNLFSGLVAKKVGIPGVFEIEFGPKDTRGPNPPPSPQPTQTAPSPQPSTLSVAPLPSPKAQPPNHSQWSLPTPNTVDLSQPLTPTRNYACPTVAGIFWLPYPNIWYGPFGHGYAVGWYSSGGFGVWNPNLYQTVNYPDPYKQAQRNVWMNLTGSPFNVCIDSYGNVYGQYWPY
jgi:hypothetical protein